MVATSGVLWRLSPCLVRLVDETDELYPSRSIASDGSIGDAAHAARESDHNPSAPRPPGYVDAVDLTDDDMHGCDVGRLAAHLVATRDPRVKYLIHKGTIWASYGSSAWQPRPYTGINAHEKHLHVSILAGTRYSTATWWPRTQPAKDVEDMTTDEMISALNAAAKAGKLDPFFLRQRQIIETGTLEEVHKIVEATDKRIKNLP